MKKKMIRFKNQKNKSNLKKMINFSVSLNYIIINYAFIVLKKNLVLLEKASNEKDFKMTATLSKNLKKLRKIFNLPDAVLCLSYYLPDLFMRLMLP